LEQVLAKQNADMQQVYENLKDDHLMEESKQDLKVDLSKLTMSFQTQIEEKTIENLNLKTELLNTKQSLA
jgi:hypothetical protein